jgi:hypothetical protein
MLKRCWFISEKECTDISRENAKEEEEEEEEDDEDDDEKEEDEDDDDDEKEEEEEEEEEKEEKEEARSQMTPGPFVLIVGQLLYSKFSIRSSLFKLL